MALLALDMGGAARDLARNTAAAVAHAPATVTVRNLSSLGPGEIADIRRVFDAELKSTGSAAADVAITISENLTEYLLVAEIHRSGDRQVLIESWPRRPSTSAAQTINAAGRVTLEKRLLWEQDQPILDAVQASDVTLVLDAARVLLIQGSEQQSVPISVRHPWPRDLRGRLSFSGAAFTAWLPATECRGALQPKLDLACRDSQDPWLLGPGALAAYAPAGNFFSGHIDVEPGGIHELPPFYSAAPAADGWMFAGVDGRARIYTHTWELAGNSGEWGSDLAAVQTPCGDRLLATRPAGLNSADAVQPYELSGGTAQPAGGALEFPGPIVALWSAGSSATAVSRDLQTGRYAAVSLVPTCGN